ncbi:cysteine desulfurase [Oceanipulchritudo coccoides]|nr:cysteine desulfurase [Oceanipulchritudo coccoides]
MPKELTKQELSALREQFPILQQEVNGKPLVYLDNAATSQKPKAVIERLKRYYLEDNANIHRGVHALSQRATDDYEASRAKVASFIGAKDPGEIVFTRGATESINLVASSLAQSTLQAGDTVLVTEMEHHANIVPWQLLRDRIGIKLATVRVSDSGELDEEDFYLKLESEKPKLVSFVHVSNSLGVINPAKKLISAAHCEGIPVLLDACQSIPHFPVDVQELDCDWLVFSGHKLFGPTGIGVLYGKKDILNSMPPYQGGGDMIESVSFEKTVYKNAPERFEAGTPHIAGAIGLAAAIEFLESMDREALLAHETRLLEAATKGLQTVPGLRIIGESDNKASVISFVMDAAHPHDVASFLDAAGIAIRSGHHCTQPLMIRLGLPGTARASFSIYNTLDEVDALVEELVRIQKFFA